MAGTIEGGKLTADTNKKKYGGDFYVRIGTMGGSKKVPKGFARMPKEKVIAAGRRGGEISRRPKES